MNTGRCHTDQAEAGNCFGGMARMFTAIRFDNVSLFKVCIFFGLSSLHFFRELQAREPSKTLTLNAGDYFQGTVWYNEFFIHFSLLEKLLPMQTTRCCTIAPSAIGTRGSQRERASERVRDSQRESQWKGQKEPKREPDRLLRMLLWEPKQHFLFVCS